MLDIAFQRGDYLTIKNKHYRSWIEKFIIEEVEGDTGNSGDITSNAIIRHKKNIEALVFSRENGILAGIEEVKLLYHKNNIKVKQLIKDGDVLKKESVILRLFGSPKNLLRIERSALDLIQRMSGIATLTYNIKKKIKNKIGIAPTRKTQWRYLDKKAVFVGGGYTHRLALWDSIIVKDNHLLVLKKEGVKNTILEALKRSFKKTSSTRFIEIEVRNTVEAIKAATIFSEYPKKNKPFILMLDNMQPAVVTKTLKELRHRNLLDNVLIEVSGGITPFNIHKYIIRGVDIFSMGYLTHSSTALNIKQKII